MVKINILYKTTDSPTGGGNQFLRNLKKWFITNDYYAEAKDADVILFNSHHFIYEVMELKKKYPDKLFIHRVAGPIILQTHKGDNRHKIVHIANKYLGDATVFQSKFSMDENIKYNMPRNRFEKVIGNAADPDIFNSIGKEDFRESEKIRLVATSWSNNVTKGFHIYQFLDQNLDFDKYDMTFIGNSPVQFKNIRMISPLDSLHLAEELRKHDIYITASKNEPCSNALIEALTCGLPAVCLNSGSNPELLKEGGLLFDTSNELCEIIDKLSDQYIEFKRKIEVIQMNDIALGYIELARQLVDAVKQKIYVPKKLGMMEEFNVKAVINYGDLFSRLRCNLLRFKGENI